MASRTSDLVGRVNPAHVFDYDSLIRYCSVNVDGFPHSLSNFSVSQFGHGQSNPTFLVEVSSGPSIMKYVLRKKPPGVLLQSAHAVEREFQVLHALGVHTEVPVPKVLLRYGSKEQLQEWLIPLLDGTIRSGFAMTEPQVASSDATNIECSIKRDGDSYVISGKKWWTSGAMDPRCRLLILMGKTDFTAPKHRQQSMILVDIKTPGIQIKRPLTVFGFDDAPHGHAEMFFENVRVPTKNILLGEGRGFEIAQGRLGPGRLHHCMRSIGAAERAIQLMAQRALTRTTFGKLIAQHGSFQTDLAKCRIELEQTRLLVLEAADQLDRLGNKEARGIIAMAKVAAPNMALKVIDRAIQVHGGAGVSSDTVLAHLWATSRTLRIADGPDEVHLGTIAKLELQRAKAKL